MEMKYVPLLQRTCLHDVFVVDSDNGPYGQLYILVGLCVGKKSSKRGSELVPCIRGLRL